jgi:hypothetical protein
MKIEIENSKLVIDIYELIEQLSTEQKLHVADAISVQDDVIQYIMDQVFDGITDLCSHAADDSDRLKPNWPLGKFKREIALRAGDVAQKQVKSLIETLKRKEAYHKEINDWAWAMYHNKPGAREGIHKYKPYNNAEDEWEVVRKEQKP